MHNMMGCTIVFVVLLTTARVKHLIAKSHPLPVDRYSNSSSISNFSVINTSNNDNNGSRNDGDMDRYGNGRRSSVMRRLQVAAGSEEIPPAFDWRLYLKYNPDLVAGGVRTEAEALSHFTLYGRREGRRYAKSMPGLERFDWRAYLELNPDIARRGVLTEIDAYNHLTGNGKVRMNIS